MLTSSQIILHVLPELAKKGRINMSIKDILKSLIFGSWYSQTDPVLLRTYEDLASAPADQIERLTLTENQNNHPPLSLQDKDQNILGTFDGEGAKLSIGSKSITIWSHETLIFHSTDENRLNSFRMKFHKKLLSDSYFVISEIDNENIIGKLTSEKQHALITSQFLSAKIHVLITGLRCPVLAVTNEDSDWLGFLREENIKRSNKLIAFGGPMTYSILLQPQLPKDQLSLIIAALISTLHQHMIEGFTD